MRHRYKLLLIAMTAAITLASAVGTASANRGFEVEPTREVSAIFRELTFGGGFGNIICPVTVHGSLHRSIAKVVGTLAGMASSVSIDITGCRESFGVGNITDVRILGLPWHRTYESFTGTLPNITAINTVVVGVQILVDHEIF